MKTPQRVKDPRKEAGINSASGEAPFNVSINLPNNLRRTKISSGLGLAVLCSGVALAATTLSPGEAWALENYDDWDPKIPVATEASTQKGVPLPGFKHFTAMVDGFSKPLRGDPTNSRYWIDRANWLMDFGLYQEAVYDLKKAQKLSQGFNADVTVKLAQCHFGLQDYAQTLWLSKKILATYKNNAPGHAVRALGLIEQPKKALAECNKALAIESNQSWIYLVRARIRQDNNMDWERSLRDCNQALKLAPDSYAAKLFRARAYVNLKKYKAAIADCNYILSKEPMYFEAYKVRSQAFARNGQKKLASLDKYLYKTCWRRMKQVVKENQS